MKYPWAPLAGLLVLLGGARGLPLAAQGEPFPSLEPDIRAAEYGSRLERGAPSWEDLAAAALWASGGEASPGAMNLLRAAAAELRASLPGEPRERGDHILSYLHRKFLRSYSATQTRVDTLLSSGRYNCVSSAALYLILAASAGMEARGVMTKDHAFAAVKAGTGVIDVETTNPYGFDPGNRREFHDAFGALTGFAYVPARNYRDRAELSPAELISLIFTNRIMELESRRNFAEGISLALNRAAFLAGRRAPSDSPLFPEPGAYLLDRVFNYGAFLIQGGREEEALRWADLAEPRLGGGPRWEEFRHVALNNLLVKELRGGRIGGARKFLADHGSPLGEESRRPLEALILEAELVKLSREAASVSAAESGILAAEAAGALGLLPGERLLELKTFFLLKAGELRAAEGGWGAAIPYAEGLLARYGANRKLEEQIRLFRSNRGAELHNSFAAAYNRRDLEEARRIIRGAREELPGDSQLRRDEELLQRGR